MCSSWKCSYFSPAKNAHAFLT
uniref:Uncharacterized protein n=1 Tax=Arundo donax TaxID=35708 RepID=A0A0A9BKI2_ARUDO